MLKIVAFFSEQKFFFSASTVHSGANGLISGLFLLSLQFPYFRCSSCQEGIMPRRRFQVLSFS
jgi:hypothetical protein